MVKAVFTSKADPGYDDLPEHRYHFPKIYLRATEDALGDWIVYYEPRRRSTDPSSRGGRQAYFATARMDGIEADPRRADHFLAIIASMNSRDELPRIICTCSKRDRLRHLITYGVLKTPWCPKTLIS